MANLFEHKDRRVVPNWRSFGRTTVLGELDSIQKERSEPLEDTSIDEYIIDFNLNKTVIYAADLIGAALVNDKRDDKVVKEAANFILDSSKNATPSQIKLANAILQKADIQNITEKFKDVRSSSISSIINPGPIFECIRDTKNKLRSYPYNVVLYVELARYYSILGQENGAIQSMKTALHLAPHNRFVLRSATRLFAHYNDDKNDFLDYIHRVLRNSPMTAIDPWLASAEISISTIRERNSRLINKGIQLINSGNISPFNFTELASSIGTVEMLNGSHKKSRLLFEQSLIRPNDNSLAQIEWASTKDNRLEIAQTDYDVKMNFEALALDKFNNDEYEDSLDNAAKWLSDQPFSKRPVMFGANLASTVMKTQERSIAFLNVGLISHPNDPQLLNNLAYSLALSNKPQEAINELNKIREESKLELATSVCLKATRGLSMFRLGKHNEGRRLYVEAIKKTKEIGNQNLNWIAILNYAREELMVNSDLIEPIMNSISQIPENPKDIEIKSLRQEVLDLYEKRKS